MVPDVGLALLAAVSGTLDALGYLRLGPALLSAMTGNLALLGLAIGQHRFAVASHAGAAFGGFVLGVAGGVLVLGDAPPGWSARVTVMLRFEAVLLGAFASLWLAGGDRRTDAMVYALILLGSTGTGLQSAAVRQLGVANVTTTFFTGTLTSLVSSAVRAAEPTRHARDATGGGVVAQVAALAAYVGAAACAGLAAAHRIEAIAAVPVAAVVVVLVVRAVAGRLDSLRLR